MTRDAIEGDGIDDAASVDLSKDANRGFVCPSCGHRIAVRLTDPDAAVMVRCVECGERAVLTDR